MEQGRNESTRSLRKEYKGLLELGSAAESNIVNDGSIKTLKVIRKIVTKADDFCVELQRLSARSPVKTSELVMDAQVIKMSHELLRSVVQTMRNTEISDDEYAAVINRLIGRNNDWDKLAEIGMKISKTFCYSQPLFGTFDEKSVLPTKEAKQRQKSKSKNYQQVKPVVGRQQKKEGQTALDTNRVMNQIMELFKESRNEPLPYFKVIIDPTNFMKTVENAFQMSFLFRDGIIGFGKDKFEYPTIRPTSDVDKNSFDESTQQMVSTLSTKLCYEMIQRYNITEASLSLNDS